MKNALVLCLVAVLAMGGGYWLGQRNAAKTPSHADQRRTKKKPQTVAELPPVRKPPAEKPASSPKSKPEKLSVTEIESKILEIQKTGPRGWGPSGERDWSKVMAHLDADDVPALLAFVDNNLSQQLRARPRQQLLQCWAESDVSGAMAYANALPIRQEREGAIALVAATWAQTDAAGVAAWVRQLPRGQLRDQILQSVLHPMSTTDPQAANDLAQSLGGSNARRWGWSASWRTGRRAGCWRRASRLSRRWSASTCGCSRFRRLSPRPSACSW